MIQKQKSELTKEKILQESFKLFYENGFKSTSIDRVMQATQLTKGAFYHHYKSKKELGLTIIRNKLQQRVYDRMVTPLYESGDPLEIIEATFNNTLLSFTNHEKEHGCALNNFINEIGDYESEYQFALKRIIEEWKSALVYIIERGKAEKLIQQNIVSEAVAMYLISSFEGIRGIRKLYNNDTVLDEYLSGLSIYIKQLALK